jgi:hypothetical protein
MKLLLRKNIVLKFKETEQKETLYRIYPDKVRGGTIYNTPRILISKGGPKILLYLQL